MDIARRSVPSDDRPPLSAPERAADGPLSPEALLRERHAHQEELRIQNVRLVEAQELLVTSLAEYIDLYDHAPVGFVTLDAQGMISRMNYAAADLLRVGRHETDGLAFHAFVSPTHHLELKRHLRRCRAGEARVAGELVLRRSDGHEVPAELISRAAVGEDGRFFRTVIVDLTERVRAEARTAELTRELERRTAEAENYASRLRALAAKLTEAENAERRRLARNLHDHLQQELIAAKFRVEIAKRAGPAGLAKLGEIEAALDQCLESSRQVTADLTPPPLQQGAGLPAALRWLVDRIHQRHGLNVLVTVTDDADPAAEAVRVMLYEVTRELLLNVIKHAGTPTAIVTLARPCADRLRLSVCDEGRGFDLAELLSRADDISGLGLFGLRERVESLGGGIEIRSGPGNGTTVTIEVPDVKLESAPRLHFDHIPR